jgi:hypothetical protein
MPCSNNPDTASAAPAIIAAATRGARMKAITADRVWSSPALQSQGQSSSRVTSPATLPRAAARYTAAAQATVSATAASR